jgi:PAS domain S-box-containing protein
VIPISILAIEAQMEQTADEIKHLQGCINDLISVQALPAVWSGQEAAQILATLLEVLVRMLQLDFAYTQASDSTEGSPIELTRFSQRQISQIEPQELGRVLRRYLTANPSNAPMAMLNPVGEGVLSVVPFRMGLQDEIGLLVAASRRIGFPTDLEMLVLRVAVNLAVISLQEARLLSAHRRIADQLEQKVNERTAQLTNVNEELRSEITERQRVEEELRGSEERFRLMVESVKDYAIFMLDPQGRVTTWNAGAERIKGYREEEILGQHFSRFYPAEESFKGKPAEQLGAAAAAGRIEDEGWRVRKDGTRFLANIIIAAVRDDEGELIGFSKVIRDITEHERAQSELMHVQSELSAELKAMTRLHDLSTRLLASAELQPLLEEILDATMALLNADFGNVQLYKPQTQALEIVAQRGFQKEFLDYFNGVREGTASCGTALSRKERVVVEDVLTDPSFSPHLEIVTAAGYRALQSTPLFSRGGEPLGMISTHFRNRHRPSDHDLRFVDLYARQAAEMIERKRAEEALHEARVELARVSRVVTIGELATSIAHEVNQPLTAVVTNADAAQRWLAGATPNLEEAREALGRIKRDGNRASDVIARIRMLVRKTGTEKEKLDMNETIQETVALAQGEARRNGVALRTELAGDVPLVLGDRVQLQQVMLNLIMNGLEAMNWVADRPRELVISSWKDQADKIRVTVKDFGVGLEPAGTERLFEAFYTTKPQGIGIGLSISRSIIEAHNGRLWAARNDGPGASFQFTLPIYAAAAE